MIRFDQSFFNSQHYYRVREARRLAGLNRWLSHTVQEPDSPWVGRYLLRLTDGKVFRVQSVCRQWYHGWYRSFLLECGGSHVLRWVENITSADGLIVDGTLLFWNEFRLLEEGSYGSK